MNSDRAVAASHYAGIFLLSLATLLLELSLTRVLSVALWYHFGFLVVSTALLGFGASGVLLSSWRRLREDAPLDRALAWSAITFGGTAVAGFWLMQRIPFDPFNLLGDARQLVLMLVYYLALAAPFFCSGTAIALLLSRGAKDVNKLYAADLAGAGVGCGAVVLAMPWLGGAGSVVCAGAVGFLSAGFFGWGRARALGACGVALALGAAALAGVADRAIPISVSSHKKHSLAQAVGEPIFTAWNTFSRVDVYELPARPAEGWPTPGLSLIIDGGTAGTGMGDLSTGVDTFLAEVPGYRPSGLAFAGQQSPRVLIIGSGAGREVLEALYFRAPSITAVEVNPIINDIVTRRMTGRFGGLFARPEVRLVTDEGRSFVRRSRDQYDAIIAIQTMSNAAIASGALSLTESYMFTREALQEYLDHLSPNGVLLITRPVTQIARLFATIREVFDARGLGSPARHLFAFKAALSPWGPYHNHTGFLLKKSPFTAAELETLERRLDTISADSSEVLYSPLHTAPGSLLHAVVQAPDLRRFYKEQVIQLAPATDDWPFFNSQTRWSRLRPGSFLYAFVQQDDRLSSVPPVEAIILVALLGQSTLIAAFLILGPLARFSHQGLRIPGRWYYLIYFAGLGLGFIMIEIVLLQRFTLFLGQPVYTFAVVLASLLVFSGAGSYAAGRIERTVPNALGYVIAAIAVTLLATTLVAPVIFRWGMGLALDWRITIAMAMVAPIGFLLGMPFPIGLRIVSGSVSALVPWAWGVNGFFTVIGSVAAMIVGMTLGFTAALVAAAACYVAALLAMWLAPQESRPHGHPLSVKREHSSRPAPRKTSRVEPSEACETKRRSLESKIRLSRVGAWKWSRIFCRAQGARA